VEGKIGGDSQLSERGMEYAKALPKLIADAIGGTPLTVRVSFHNRMNTQLWTFCLSCVSDQF
jgi:hypothetical protein